MAVYPEQLSWDSVRYLTINNLVEVNSKRPEPVTLTLQRCEAVEQDGKVCFVVPEDPDEEDTMESTTLPRLFDLELSVVDTLGEGRSGTVFSTSLKSLWEFTDPNSTPIDITGLPCLPPLVVKVAKHGSFPRIAKEALSYRVLMALQGIAIPRYYGWFNYTLDEGMMYPGAESRKDPSEGHILSVLLLEKMGDHLDLKESDEDIEDMKDMLHDVARLRVEHDDVRYDNLLRAPSSPPGLPGEVCGTHGRQHKFRLIDLESMNLRSKKSVVSEMGSLYAQLKDLYLPRRINEW